MSSFNCEKRVLVKIYWTIGVNASKQKIGCYLGSLAIFDTIIIGIFHSFEAVNYVNNIRLKNIMSSL